MIEIIKFILYLIPIIFVAFNILDNILMESIKSKYSYIPGKFSKFGKVINFSKWTIIVISFIILTFDIIYFFSGKLSFSNGSENILINRIAFISTFLLVLNMVLTIWSYYKIKEMFIEKLEKGKNINGSDNKCTINLFGIKFNFEIDIRKIKLKLVNFNTVTSYVNVGVYTIVTTYFAWICRNELYKYRDGLLLFVYLLAISSIISIVSSSTNKIADEIRANNKEYIFIYGDNESIKTTLYLEYNDEYLLIKDGYEIFIPKSTIKRKVVRYK